jgi:hypothetical protein
MPIRQFEPRRTIEVIVPRYGSGYRIGGRLVLTAAHLLDNVGSDCEVRDKRSFGKEKAQVVWKAQGLDIALIELPEKIAGLEAITLGKLPEATAGEKLAFQMYAYPLWAQTQREQGSAAGGRQIEGVIYLSDRSPDGLLVLEAERLPPEGTTAQSEWEGASGAAINCDGLVIAVQMQHQNPSRPASLEATPLWEVYEDEQWRQWLKKHGINSEPEIVGDALTNLPWRNAYQNVLVDVGVERNDESPASVGVKMLAMKYVIRTQDETFSVEPDCDYLDTVRNGKPTKAFSYSPDPFPVSVPVLKIRILNNSGGQIIVNRVALAVERSCPTAESFLVVVNHSRPGRSILVVNEGTGESGPCTIRYGLLPITQTDSPDFSDLPYEITTEGFDRSWLADLSAGLAAEGLNLQALDALKCSDTIISAQGCWMRIQNGEFMSDKERDDRIRQLCGEFLFPKARVIGCLECRGASGSAERIFFESTVSFLEGDGYFPHSTESQEWNLTLSTEGEKYDAAIPADDIIKSGESVELKMSVGAMRPSWHRLSVQVRYNHDHIASSPPLSLRIFVPRSSYEDRTWEWLYRG